MRAAIKHLKKRISDRIRRTPPAFRIPAAAEQSDRGDPKDNRN